MSPVKRLLDQIHRRSLWQVLGLYLAGSWVTLEVVATFVEQLFLPSWLFRGTLIFLALGLPIVLATAFLQRGIRSKPAVTPTGLRGLFTWRRALTAGALVFASLGLGVMGHLASRASGIGPAATLAAKGLIEEQAEILVADFGGDDRELANTATDALVIDLSQSRVVSIVEKGEIGQALQRMQREPDSVLDLELAREVAIREGIPVVLAGQIDRAGPQYSISARLVRASDGEVLASHRERAANDGEVLDALDALSARLRERLGESIGLMNAEEPLAQVTTASISALRLYSQAVRASDRQGDGARAIALLEGAVADDPAFAMAWRALGVVLGNQFTNRAREVEAFTAAFEHRDRLTERERYQIEGMYYYSVSLDLPRAAAAYQNLLERYPNDDNATHNLGVVTAFMRQHVRAADLYERTIALDSSQSLGYTNAALMHIALGDYERARHLLDLILSRSPDNPWGLWHLALLESSRGEYKSAVVHLERLNETHAADPYWAGQAATGLAAVASTRGRLSEARAHFDLMLQRTAAADEAAPYHATVRGQARMELAVRGDSAGSLRLVAEARSRFPLDSMEVLDRPHTDLARFYASAGAIDQAKSHIEAFERDVPRELWGDAQRIARSEARSEIARGEGRWDEALEEARAADLGWCLICGPLNIARIADEAGRPKVATEAYRRYLETNHAWRLIFLDRFHRGPVLERLGQLYDAAGDLENSAKYYAMFVELWADADEELQPRVATAQGRLEEILAERG